MSKKRIAILAVICISLLYLLLCFFSPATYKYSSEIKIDGPYKMAYIVINDIKDWPKWYSWDKTDDNFIYSKGGRDLYIGANFSFESSHFGSGVLELQESFPDSLITARLKTEKLPGEVILNWQIIPEGTKSFFLKTNYRIPGKIPFFKRALYFGFDRKLNQIFNDDLQGLKDYIEKLVSTDFAIKKEKFGERYYFGIMDLVVNSKIPQFYAKNLPKVYNFLDSMGIQIIGPPAGLIFGWDAIKGQVFLLAALQVDKPVANYKGWTSYTVKPTETFKLEHFGSYNTLRNAHTKLSYMMDNSDYILGAPIVEEYVTSPSQEPDTTKWLTNVYYLFDNTGGYSKSVEKIYTLEDVVKMEELERKEQLKKMIK